MSRSIEEKLMLGKPKRKKKPKHPWPFGTFIVGGAVCALNCTILAVDPGEVSGWCIWQNGKIRAYGHFNIFSDANAIEGAFDALLVLPGPHILVVERPFSGSKFGISSTGVGAGDVTWRARAKLRGVKKHVRVFPAMWRSKVLPKATSPDNKGWHVAKRDEVREEEQRIALVLLAEQNREDIGCTPDLTIHPDVAPAVCIGQWASYAAEVHAKLPKRYQQQERAA